MGTIHVAVVNEKIGLNDFQKHLAQNQTQPDCGADSIFIGRVRDFNNNKKVLGVSYDAFKPLTEKVFVELCQEAQERWGTELNFVVLHRVGRLDVADISVLIAVSSPHRDEAYEASRYVIEELKVRAPVWKKEHYETGDSEWLKGHELCQHHHRSSNKGCNNHSHRHQHENAEKRTL